MGGRLRTSDPVRELLALPFVVVMTACGVAGTDVIDLGGRGGSRAAEGGAESTPSPDASGGTQFPLGCSSDADCAAPRARCDATTGDCVECLAPEDCRADNRTCDLDSHVCIDGCSSDLACPPVVPHCYAETGECLVCTEDAHCAGHGDDIKCDVELGRCVDCISNADCTFPGRALCEPLFRECVECISDADCTPPATCAGPSGAWRCVL